MKKTYLIVLVLSLLFSVNTNAQKKNKAIYLLDKDLSNFDIWLSVPHTSITGLPEGTYQNDNVGKGEPIGLNNNLKNVFSIIEEDGEPVLKITGEIFGCISSKATYENYYLSVQFKWGDKKWKPRLDKKRDSGILYHCYGEHGMFLNTWKMCLEYQVQETDLGDFIPLSGGKKVGSPTAEIRGDFEKDKRFDPNSEIYSVGKGYIHAASEHDKPNGEWNHLEIYIVGNDAVHLVNGEVVMVVENAKKHDGTILDKGEIQIQSEAAECYYKALSVTPIKKFPKKIKKQVRFK